MSTLSQQIFAPDGAEVYSNLFMPRARETCCFCFPLREGLLICAILLVMLDTAALYGAFIRLWEPSTDWHMPFVNASAPGCAAGVISSPTLEEGHNHTAPPPNNPEARPSTYLIKNSRLPAVPNAKKTYLGRPWGNGSTVIYSNCFMDSHIAAAGWYETTTQSPLLKPLCLPKACRYC